MASRDKFSLLREKTRQLWSMAAKDCHIERVEAVAAVYHDIQVILDELDPLKTNKPKTLIEVFESEKGRSCQQ